MVDRLTDPALEDGLRDALEEGREKAVVEGPAEALEGGRLDALDVGRRTEAELEGRRDILRMYQAHKISVLII